MKQIFFKLKASFIILILCFSIIVSESNFINRKDFTHYNKDEKNYFENLNLIQTFTSKDLPDLIKFQFVSKESKLIHGQDSIEYENNKPGDKPRISKNDILGNLAVVSMFYQNFCYTDGKYNHNDWQVQRGILKGDKEYEAFNISPPQKKATIFLGSHHKIFFKFSQKQEYQVLLFENLNLSLIQIVKASQITTSGYTLISDFDLSTIQTSKTIVFIPLSQRISVMTRLSEGVEGAKLFDNGKVKIEERTYSVNFSPSLPEDFNSGPAGYANIYSALRNFFLIVEGESTGVFCQDKQGKGHLIRFSSDWNSATTVNFNIDNDFTLGAAVAGNPGEIFYLIIQKGNAGDKVTTRKIILVKANSKTGKEIARNQLDSSKNKLNFYEISTGCLLVFNGKEIAMYISRTMTLTADGLNHQGGICVLFNPQTLQIIIDHGVTSSHSFGNSIIILKDSSFLGMDLGDSYPRGINIWTFDKSKKKSKVVYTFKTLHGSTPSPYTGGPTYPIYTEISIGGKTFYKWSNDNKTYSELGAPGIVELNDGFSVFFVGESPSLDNSKVGENLNAARNIGFVKIDKNLSNILSIGKNEKGGFYDFGGKFNNQENKGIVWITQKTNKNNNVSRLKNARIGTNKNLLLFECWTPDNYLYTAFAVCDDNGKLIIPETKVDYPIRLHKADNVFVINGKVLFISGKNGNKISYYIATVN